MNRTFLLALPLVFVFACGPQPAPTHNGNGNSNSANANHSEGIAGAPATIPVVITVGTKPNSDTYFLSVAPYEVTLSAGNGDQIEWIISNPFPNVNLSNIKIGDFKGGTPTPNTDPFGNGGSFNFAYVAPQATAYKMSGTTNKYGTYDYVVTGKATIGTTTVTLTKDPRVVVGD